MVEEVVLRVFAFLVTMIRAWEAQEQEWDVVNVVMVLFGLITVLFGSKKTMILATVGNMIRTWKKMPFCWDNYFWELHSAEIKFKFRYSAT